MMIAAVLFLVSALGAGAANTSAIFIIARFIGGVGVGAASVLSPVYISEVTPASIRGRLSSLQQIMIITGLTGAFVANYALAHWAGGSQATLDVLDAGDPGGDLFLRADVDPREPALPGNQGP
jgi:SP family sugar:H+ symporter-like MFS transporter